MNPPPEGLSAQRPAPGATPARGTHAEAEQLVADYRPMLARYAAHLLGRDQALGEDVAQDVFERYLRQSDEQKQALREGSIKAWLFTVCRNRALDLRRKDKRMTTMIEDKQRQASEADPAHDPARVAQQRDMQAVVLNQINTLPGDQQEVIRLRFTGELTYAQIAQVTGLTAGNVGYLLHHGLKTLRKQLAPAGEV